MVVLPWPLRPRPRVNMKSPVEIQCPNQQTENPGLGFRDYLIFSRFYANCVNQ